MSEEFIRYYADRREDLHENHDSSRPLSEDYEYVGLAGELAFANFSGYMMDLSEKPKGDGGTDFNVFIRARVDVKTARKAYYLIHEQGKEFVDIYVLAQYRDETKDAILLGWEYGGVLRNAPVRDFNHGIMNHYIPRENLKSMSELRILKI